MTKKYLASLGVSSALLVAGCASNPEVAVAASSVSSPRLRIWSVRTEDSGDSILVRGVVRRALLDVRPLYGHLHVTAYFKDARPAIAADTLWSYLKAQSPAFGTYSVRLPVSDPAALASIIVVYRSNPD